MPVFLKTPSGETRRAALLPLDLADLPQFLALYEAAEPSAKTAFPFYGDPEGQFRSFLFGGELWALSLPDGLAAAAGWFLPAARSLPGQAAPPDVVRDAVLSAVLVAPPYRDAQPQAPLLRQLLGRIDAALLDSVTAHCTLRDLDAMRRLFSLGFRMQGMEQSYFCLPRYVFRRRAALPGPDDLQFCLPALDSFAVTRALADGAEAVSMGSRSGEAVLWFTAP